MNNKKSLNFVITAIIVLVILSTMTIFLSYNYTKEKEKLYNNLEVSSKILSQRLKTTLSHFIESYSINEYKEIIKDEFNDKNIYAIIIEDYITGSLHGSDYITGKKRDKNWNVIDYDETNKILKDEYLYTEFIITSTSNEIGKLKVYFTYKFANEELNKLIKNSIFIAITISLISILLFYILLRRYILKPIHNITNNIQNVDKYGMPIERFNVNDTFEFNLLSNTLNKMLEEIKYSKIKLEESEFQWKTAIEGNGDGLWNWNLETNEVYFSNRYNSMLGYKENELENTLDTFKKLCHKDYLEYVFKELSDYLEGKSEKFNVKFKFLSKDGSYKWIQSKGTIVQNVTLPNMWTRIKLVIS